MLSGGFQPGLISHLSLPAAPPPGGLPTIPAPPCGLCLGCAPLPQYSHDWHPCFTRVSAHMSPSWSLKKDFCPILLLYYSALTNTAFKSICLLFYCAPSPLGWDLRGHGDHAWLCTLLCMHSWHSINICLIRWISN